MVGNKFSRCYSLFMLLAAKYLKHDFRNEWDKNIMNLLVMIVKAKTKKEFGIKSLRELKGKKLKEFEKFLEAKL